MPRIWPNTHKRIGQINDASIKIIISHYYNHENVGAYLSYGLLLNFYIENDSDKNRTLYIPWLIGSHMGPFSNNKYYKNLPTYLKNDIDMLHRADLEAH